VSAPCPPADLAARDPNIVKLAAGTVINRFYTAGMAPIYFDPSRNGRLNSPDGGYGVLYAAASDRGAFAETFLRSPGRRQIDPGLLARKAFVRLRLTRAIALVDLHGPGLAILGATAEIVHGGLPYDIPQAWSNAIHAHPIGADGIAYSARHDDAEICHAIFDRAAAKLDEADRVTDLDADWFWRIADIYEMGRPA